MGKKMNEIKQYYGQEIQSAYSRWAQWTNGCPALEKMFTVEQFRWESRRFEVGHREPSRRRVVFVNGIVTSFDESVSHAKHLSEQAKGVQVQGVWNATHGFLDDLRESKLNLDRYATPPVRLIHEVFNEFFERNYFGELLLFGHSQGAIHCRNALESYPYRDRLRRISFVGIAPAAYTNIAICKKVDHYVSPVDLVPTIDDRGRKMAQQQDSYHEVYADPNLPKAPLGMLRKWLGETFGQLTSRMRASFEEHGFQHSIYRQALADHLDQFLEGPK